MFVPVIVPSELNKYGNDVVVSLHTSSKRTGAVKSVINVDSLIGSVDDQLLIVLARVVAHVVVSTV